MIFVVDIRSVQYLNRHPDILLFDCTYQTNKFDMPLLNIIGVDHHGNSRTVALCWLDQEAEKYYNEAIQHLVKLFKPEIWPSVIATDCELALIQAITKHFPAFRTKRVLCFWHTAKCVTTNCKAFFSTMERWEFDRGFRDVVYAKTPDQYEDIIFELMAEFHGNDGNPHTVPPNATLEQQATILSYDLERQAVAYILGQQLTLYSELLVHAWVNRFFHGETTVTSRLEGGHSVLKR